MADEVVSPDPFGRDANDLPLRFLHFQFVNKLNQLHRSQLTDADHEALRQVPCCCHLLLLVTVHLVLLSSVLVCC